MAAFSTPRCLTALALVSVCQALPQLALTKSFPINPSVATSTSSSGAVPCIHDVCTPPVHGGATMSLPMPTDVPIETTAATLTMVDRHLTHTPQGPITHAQNTTITITTTRSNPSADEPPRFTTMVKVVPLDSVDEEASNAAADFRICLSGMPCHTSQLFSSTKTPGIEDYNLILATHSAHHTANSTAHHGTVSADHKPTKIPFVAPGGPSKSAMPTVQPSHTHTGPARGP